LRRFPKDLSFDVVPRGAHNPASPPKLGL